MSTPPIASSSSSSSNPVKLLVQTRDRHSISQTSGNLVPGGTLPPEAILLKTSLARKAEYLRKAEKWGDKMMEEVLSRKEFKRGLKYVSPQSYSQIIHERHLNHHCCYPTCPNPPEAPYSTAKRFSISTKNRTIKPISDNADQGYCGKVCRLRGEWVSRELERLGNGEDLELLEEMEERGEFMVDMRSKDELINPRKKDDPPRRKGSTNSLATSDNPTGQLLDQAIHPSPRSVAEQPQTPLEKMLSEIQVHERETPSHPPIPPSLNPLPTSNGSTSKPLNPSPSSPSPSNNLPPTTSQEMTRPSKTTATSPSALRRNHTLVPTPTKLVSSILSSAKQLGPMRQLDPDSSDGDESLLDPDELNPLGMGGWSEDEDVKGWFEEARAARELMEDDEKDI